MFSAPSSDENDDNPSTSCSSAPCGESCNLASEDVSASLLNVVSVDGDGGLDSLLAFEFVHKQQRWKSNRDVFDSHRRKRIKIMAVTTTAVASICLLSSAMRPFRPEHRPSLLYSHRIPWGKTTAFLFANSNYRILDQQQQQAGDANDEADAADGLYDDATYSATDNATNATDDNYYYVEQEPVYIEDDFFRYIDDDVKEDQYSLFPLQSTDMVGFTCVTMTLILVAGGGIGGGGILVAIYIIVMHFPVKNAIPLSSVTGLGGAFAATMNNARKRHPLADRPLIAWDLVLVMQPLTLLGALYGTLLNKLLSEKFLLTMLVLLLSVIAHHTLSKAKKMYMAEEMYIKKVQWARAKKEHMYKQLFSVSSSGLAEADPPFVPMMTHNLSNPSSAEPAEEEGPRLFVPRIHNPPAHETTTNHGPDETIATTPKFVARLHSIAGKYRHGRPPPVVKTNDMESVRSSIMEEEAIPLPQHKITYIVAMFLFIIATNTLKGGGAFESPLGIKCGSIAFWSVNCLTTIWLLGCTYLAGKYLLVRHRIKQAVGFDYVNGDIRWDMRTIVIYPSTCVIAGLVSGMFGIASSIVTAPLMVGIGVHPVVAAATSACIVLFTCLAATTSYIVLGAYENIDYYPVACLCTGIITTFFGQFVMSMMTSKTGGKGRALERHSYIAYIMGTVVLVSALLMTAELLITISHPTEFDEETHRICDVYDNILD